MTGQSTHSDASPPVRWFLDIDGTISPFGLTEPWPGPTLYGGPADSDLAVPYRRELARAIQRLQGSGAVEVVWLTTWDADAVDAWTKVGLGPFPLVRRRKAGHDRWWKVDAVQTWMRRHPNRRVVWTDDDISVGGLRGFDRSRLLAISPDPTVGLTDKHVAKIERWATEARQR